MFDSLYSSLQLGLALAGGAVAGATAAITTTALALAGWLALAWLVTALLVARGAMGRGRSAVGWFLLAILLAPPVAALMLLVMPDLVDSRQRSLAGRNKAGLRLCPSCDEVVRARAKCCRYCGVDLERLDRQQAAQAAQATSAPLGQGRSAERQPARHPPPLNQRTDPQLASPEGRRAETLAS